MSHSIGPPDGLVGTAGGGGDLAPGVLRSGCRAGARVNIMTLVAEKMSKANAQARSEERASTVATGRAFMPPRRTKRIRFQRGRGPLPVCHNTTRGSVRAQRASCSPGLSPPASGSGTERSEAASQRASIEVAAATQRSGVKRTETDGVRLARGGSLRGWRMVPRRRPRRAGRSIVAGARVPAPSRAVCRRQAKPAPTLWRVLSQARDEALAASHLCQRSEAGIRCRARTAMPLPVSRLSCAGNAVEWSRSLRSEKRNGVDAPAQVVESGPHRDNQSRDGARSACSRV